LSHDWMSIFYLAGAAGGTTLPQAQERRRARRYPLRIDLRYRRAESAGQSSGEGATCDISSKAVRFIAEAPPPAGAILEIAMLWPLRLGDALPLRLIVTGPVLRADSRGTVMLIKSFHFVRAAELENAEPAQVAAEAPSGR
jgi:hypothetical protein